MFHLSHLRSHAKLLVGLILALAVLLSWAGSLNYSLSSQAARSDIANKVRSVNPAAGPESIPAPTEPDETTRTRVNEAYGQLPLSFEANQGQTDPQVKFLSRGSGYSLFLTPTEAVLSLKKSPQSKAQSPKSKVHRSRTPDSRLQTPDSSAVLRMKLMDANPQPQLAGLDELPGTSNYFIGDDPA
ncbi:MAG: hypothetical protein H0T45_09650, partial [Pyrinomonadaceae bacterium]|nr:hypothetical protein [Pyrinomonadaceae bacterium]